MRAARSSPMCLTCSALALVGVLLSIAGGTVSTAADRVDELVEQQMRRQRIPGLALAVVRNGAVVNAAGYGVADRARNVAVTPDTVFRIGSISKTLLATAIMKLVEDGRVRPDDPLRKYLDVPASWAPITIERLLTHTSGLVRDPPGVDWAEPQGAAAEIIGTAFGEPLQFAPGSRSEYSNLNYIVLAEVIRVAAGRPWNEYVADTVFRPAAMTSTHLFTTSLSSSPARGYSDNDRLVDAVEWVTPPASGGYQSTVLDLARWDVAMTSNRLISESTRQRMLTPATLTNGARQQFGIGFNLRPFNGHPRAWSRGGLPGFLSEYWHFPQARLTVIVLVNLDDADVVAIAGGVASMYLPQAGR